METTMDIRRSSRASSTHTATTMRSPVGELVIVASEVALVGVYFGAIDDPRAFEARRLERAPGGSMLERAVVALHRYFDGETAFDLPLAAEGTPFQRAVWDALVEIPAGETRSYADIARAIGRPSAVRAVGAANGRNPISIVVPCHRVIGSDASLTGYAGGVPQKAWLLAHERKHLTR